jgi:hypothetical protein
MILHTFTLFVTVITMSLRLIECLVLAVFAAWLAMHVAEKILDKTEKTIKAWSLDARRAHHIVYQSSTACVGFLIVGGFAFDGLTVGLRLVVAVVATCLARAYLRTI